MNIQPPQGNRVTPHETSPTQLTLMRQMEGDNMDPHDNRAPGRTNRFRIKRRRPENVRDDDLHAVSEVQSANIPWTFANYLLWFYFIGVGINRPCQVREIFRVRHFYLIRCSALCESPIRKRNTQV